MEESKSFADVFRNRAAPPHDEGEVYEPQKGEALTDERLKELLSLDVL